MTSEQVTDTKATATDTTKAAVTETGKITETTTALADGVKDDKPVAAPADWPTDWRVKAETGIEDKDGKIAKRLERFGSPADAVKAWLNADKLISSGQLKKPLADNPTAEELTAWRKDNGVPDKPDGYDTKLPDGLVIGETDKPKVAKFIEAMHGANASQATVTNALTAYYKMQDAEMADRADKDAEIKAGTEDTLRAEWGADYRRNMGAVQTLIAGAPKDVAELIQGARLADGSPLGNHAGVLGWLSGIAREINPTATVVPGGGQQAIDAVEAEISTIRGLMKDPQSKYWKGPDADKMQKRYTELLSARERASARTRAA